MASDDLTQEPGHEHTWDSPDYGAQCIECKQLAAKLKQEAPEGTEVDEKGVVLGACRFYPGTVDIQTEDGIRQTVPAVVFEFHKINEDKPMDTLFYMPLTSELAAAIMNSFAMACTDAIVTDMVRRVSN